MPDVDDVLMQLGKFGKWQVVIFIILCIGFNWSIAWHAFSIAFMAPEIPHHCNIPGNQSVEECIPPWSIDETQADPCNIYTRCLDSSVSGNETTTCTKDMGWTYDMGPFETTLTSQFDLVCGDAFKSSLLFTGLIGGAIPGSIIFGVLADIFGRKPIFILSNVGSAIVGLIQAFMPNYWAILALSVVKGFLGIGVISAGLTMTAELFASDLRVVMGMGVQFFWAMGSATLAVWAFALREWSHLMIGLSCTMMLSVAYIWALPESIQWLVSVDRIEEAVAIVGKAARFNKMPIDVDTLYTEDDKEHKKETKYTRAIDIFTAPMMRRYTVGIIILNMCVSFGYWGLSFSGGQVGLGPYLGFLINALIEIPAIFVCVFTIPKYGRRLNLVVFFIISAAILIAVNFVPVDDQPHLVPLQLTLIYMGKFTVSAVFMNVIFYMPEIFPTTHRALGLGPAYLAGLVAGTIAPYVLMIGATTGLPWIPNVLFAAFSLLGAIVSVFMPETATRALAETIEDVQGWTLKVDEEEKQRYLSGLNQKRRASQAKVDNLRTSLSQTSLPDDPFGRKLSTSSGYGAFHVNRSNSITGSENSQTNFKPPKYDGMWVIGDEDEGEVKVNGNANGHVNKAFKDDAGSTRL